MGARVSIRGETKRSSGRNYCFGPSGAVPRMQAVLKQEIMSLGIIRIQ